VFQKQPIMRRVVYSLVPVFLFAVYLYGWRTLAVVAVSYALGILTEWFFERNRSGKVSEAVLVSCALYALALPPRTPLWIVGVGIVFAVLFGKMVYGGFGRNIFNPAITGRLFVYIAFPTALSLGWMNPGGFGMQADAIASATPLAVLRAGGQVDLVSLLLGLRGGSLGESSILLLGLAAAYLVATKTANWRIIASTIVSAALLNLGLQLAGVPGVLPTLPALMSGSFFFISIYMVTDPVSAPKKPAAQFIYGLIIGVCSILIRNFSAFPEGTSFGLLIGNTFASLIDQALTPKPKEVKA
jgi:Na+-transporting NADH:ubiquinone oxidoreductase subunit B